MLQQSLTLAILFADISGSTSLYETLGDEDAHKLVSTCIHELSGVVADHRGTVIKTIGDGIMCTFPATDKAIEAAIAMQESIDSLPLSPPENHINVNIRIGIHWGPVIKQNYDVFGDAVNVAARMVSRAKSRQILTTQQTVDNLPEGCAANIKRIDRTTIKGKAGEVSIFEIGRAHV